MGRIKLLSQKKRNKKKKVYEVKGKSKHLKIKFKKKK